MNSKNTLKNFLQQHCLDNVLFQDSKLEKIERMLINSIRCSKDIGWAEFDSIGKSGGPLILWDKSIIINKEVLNGCYNDG